jgi:hypothetical protein
MKLAPRKLALTRETLHALTARQLTNAAAGVTSHNPCLSISYCAACPSNQQTLCCTTN